MNNMSVMQALSMAWRLRWPFLASNLAFNILLVAFLAPLVAGTMRLMLSLSGEPALSDFDIAMFLLTPTGAVALLLASGLSIMLMVMNAAIMMGIAIGARRARAYHLGMGLDAVLPKWRQILVFSVLLTLRILGIALPFIAVAGGIYLNWLTEFDINFYLSTRPPVFYGVVAGAGLSLGLGAILLVQKMLGWALALPLVIFSEIAPAAGFTESRTRMQGRRLRLLRKLAIWAALSVLAFTVSLTIVGGVSAVSIDETSHNIREIARTLILFSLVLSALNLLLSTMTTGTLAVLLADFADWPEPQKARANWLSSHLFAVLGVGVIVCVVLGAVSLNQISGVQIADRVDVIAHRGAAGARPENTMSAIEKAIEDGADWIEIDVQETADGEVVVIHDSDFMKIGGDPLKIWDATMEDITRIDVGSWFDPAYSDQRVPRLSEVLEAARGKAGVLIELKYYGHDEALEKRVAEVVESFGDGTEVKAMSLKYGAVQKMKDIRPDWKVGLLSSASVGQISELNADFVAVNAAVASASLVREMRAAGKKLYVWTVNDSLQMSRMISLGVDGLITDEPELARDVVSHRRQLSTAERLVLALANFLGLGAEEKVYRDVSP